MPAPAARSVVHFDSAAEFRRWLLRHHKTATELRLGFWRKDSGRAGLTYSDALDQALCFGWIDGVRHKVDALRYTNRFTPRRPRSHWSVVNLRRFAALQQAGRVHASGLAAHTARDPANVARASFEQKSVAFPPALARRFRAECAAWRFFSRQPSSYRRVATWWIISAKREETQLRRLATLIADSAAGRRLAMLTPKSGRTAGDHARSPPLAGGRSAVRQKPQSRLTALSQRGPPSSA